MENGNGVISEKTEPTYKFLYEKYENQLSVSDALDYKSKLVQFFSLLIEIDQKNKKKSNESKNNGNTNCSY